jgi:branched-chain amino acid transport system substrate-binding protein
MRTKDAEGDISRRSCLIGLSAPLLLPHTAQAQGVGGKEILIGRTLPQSGPMVAVVTGFIEGEAAAIQDVNERGGIYGRPIKLVFADDAFDGARALQNAKELVEKKGVIALFGVIGTEPVAATLPYAAEKKIPMIAAYTGSPALRVKPHPTFFTTQASYIDELAKIVRTLVTLQSLRIAIAYQDNGFGKLLLPYAQKAITDQGGTVTGAVAVENSGANAVAQAKALAALRPNAVILIAAGPSVVAWVKACKANIGIPVYTFSLSASVATVKQLGEDARGLAVARVTPYPWQGVTPLTREFHESMRRNGNLPTDYDRFLGYINARVLIEGLRAAGRDPTPQSLIAGMERLGRLDLGGYALNYSPTNHHGSPYVDITVIGPEGKPMK